MEVNVKMNDGTERKFTINPNKKDSETVRFFSLLLEMADKTAEPQTENAEVR